MQLKVEDAAAVGRLHALSPSQERIRKKDKGSCYLTTSVADGPLTTYNWRIYMGKNEMTKDNFDRTRSRNNFGVTTSGVTTFGSLDNFLPTALATSQGSVFKEKNEDCRAEPHGNFGGYTSIGYIQLRSDRTGGQLQSERTS